MNIGITGNKGFIGTHLSNTINLFPNKFKLINFDKSYLSNELLLDQFVSSCDVIVHLAGINRSEDPDILFNTNIDITNSLISSLIRTNSKPHILFSSSTQETINNVYGNSKFITRNLLSEFCKKRHIVFTGLIIPNVYGPFCKPNYNSVIATFSHQLLNNQTPTIHTNSDLNLLYIDDLVQIIINIIEHKINSDSYMISKIHQISVSSLLEKLILFFGKYISEGIIPNIHNKFDLNLFNTFRSYINYEKYFPRTYINHEDYRGSFTELMKLDEGVNGQISFSKTNKNITRGNHFHTRKIERFCVIKGNAIIRLRRIGDSKIIEYELSGSNPMYVDIPIWTTHNITNIGNETLYTIFWINEFYNSSDPDTFFEIV